MDERTNMTSSSRGITVVFHHIDIVNVTTEVFPHDNCLMPHINFIILSAQVEKKCCIAATTPLTLTSKRLIS